VTSSTLLGDPPSNETIDVFYIKTIQLYFLSATFQIRSHHNSQNKKWRDMLFEKTVQKRRIVTIYCGELRHFINAFFTVLLPTSLLSICLECIQM